MTIRVVDEEAVRTPQRSGLARCLYVPIGARDVAAIERYVGRIVGILAGGEAKRALLVEPHDPEERDTRLPIWKLGRAAIFHAPRQVWVHVDFTAYRQAYIEAFPDESLHNRVLDHVMNRRVARLKSFAYLRIIPISRGAN